MSLQQTNARPISNKQQLDLSTQPNLLKSPAPIQGETVKIEVSADQAEWSETFDVEVSKYPNKKSKYRPVLIKARYLLAKKFSEEMKVKYPPENGWKHRVIKRTYAKIAVTTLVKTEILKP